MNQRIFADLHNHTTASDGDFTPCQLVEKAKSIGLKAIGITDHDTLGGLKEAVAAGEKYGIAVIPGVEVSVRFKRAYFTGTLHLLSYFSIETLFDDQFNVAFKKVLSQGRGENLVRARIFEINKIFGPNGETPLLGRDLLLDDIASLSKNATRRHFALALKKDFNISDDNILNSIIGNDSRAYLPSGVQLEKVVDFISEHRIFLSLAHPAAGSFPGKGHYKEVLPPLEIVERILPEFIQAGIQGLEVYYPGHTKEHQSLMSAWAQKHQLLKTGGSDCHDGVERPCGVSGISKSEYRLFQTALT